MSDEYSSLEAKIHSVLSRNHPGFDGDISPRVPAAVLIPFVHTNNEWHLLFTKRTNGVAKHRGEISFPGGGAEDEDADLIQTAIREACEEIGLCEESIHVIGVMESVQTVSNYCVLPVIGTVKWPLDLRLNPTEVENTLLIPVSWLKKDENWYVQDFYFAPSQSKPVLHYRDFNGEHLWGFTAGLAQKITSLI